MSSTLPSLACLDEQFLYYDKEWTFHRLPKENVEIPRDHLPDPDSDAIPGTAKQDTLVDFERHWTDTGIDRIFMGPHHTLRVHHLN